MTTTINAAGSPEALYGVPAAAELEALANQLFPDLIGEAAVPSGTVPAAPAEVPAPAPEVPAVGYGIPAGTSFDWEHPFAAAPSGAETEKLTPGYAPVVLSASDAASGKVPEQTAAPSAVTPRGSNDSIRIGSKTLAEIRGDFPILAEKVNGNSLVWLDNGATTQRPQQVIDRISYYYQHENSNVHRGAHTLAARSTDAYENARDIVRDFIGAGSSSEIVFVRGTTEAINLVANAYVKPTLRPGDEIIVSILEHHANIVPWQLIAQKTGAVLRVIPCDETGQLILSEYEKLFTSRTKFVAVTHVSNVLGTVTPVAELIISRLMSRLWMRISLCSRDIRSTVLPASGWFTARRSF